MSQFRSLTPARQQLVRLMQKLHFGMLRNLRICSGQPDLDSTLEIVEDVKLDGQRGPRPEHALDDFQLKDQVLEFLHELDRLGTGTVTEVAVRHGQPCRLLITRQGTV